MSRAAQDWAAEQLGLDPQIRWTLWHLADFAQPDGSSAFPSLRTLQLRAGISESTARRHLRQLEQFRYIERGDDLLTAHYRADRRPHVWNVRVGQVVGLRTMQPGLFPAVRSHNPQAVDNPPSNPVDNPNGVSPVTPGTGCQIDPSRGVIAVTPNPRTEKDLLRARRSKRQPVDNPACSDDCRNPRVGAGRGWLADTAVLPDGSGGNPVACPICRTRYRRRAPF